MERFNIRCALKVRLGSLLFNIYLHGLFFFLFNVILLIICESNDVKLLGKTTNKDLKFHKHFLKLCSKANQKLSVHSRRAKLLYFNFKKWYFRSFYGVSVQMCPIFWMFHIWRTNKKINRLHERDFGDYLWWRKRLFVRRECTISLRFKPELVLLSVNPLLKDKNLLQCFGTYYQSKLEKIICFCHLKKTMKTKCLPMCILLNLHRNSWYIDVYVY